MHKKERTEKLKRNVKYLIDSRGESRISLCNSSGLTRTTIYNILEGRVVNVQQSTIRKISDFFGVSYEEIESVDFEEKEIIEATLSLHGNKNPAAVPVIKESFLLQSLDKRIGELVVSHPLTYYFGMASNLIGVLLEGKTSGGNDAGDLLIVRKGVTSSSAENLVYDRSARKLMIVIGSHLDSGVCVIGELVEERFNVGSF
ncbi:helix-turn-helix domain-containing protein [Pseudomonas sp. Eth.TT006]